MITNKYGTMVFDEKTGAMAGSGWLPFENFYDLLFSADESNVICYDYHNNGKNIFTKLELTETKYYAKWLQNHREAYLNSIR